MSESTPAIAPPQSIRPQLTLWQLLVVITTMAVGLGTYAWVGWLALGIWGTAIWFVASYYGWLRPGQVELAFVLVLSVIFLTPMIVETRRRDFDAVRANQARLCRNRFIDIRYALLNYHDVHGSYPPIATFTDSGRPMHSWRTHILPYLERADLEADYSFVEPWDGPTNQQLHTCYIPEFYCRLDTKKGIGDVSYLAIVDPQAKPGEPFAVIEVHHSGINFFEPRDVTVAELLSPDSPLVKDPRGPHGWETMHALLRDGTVQRLTPDELLERLREGRF